MPDDPGQEPNRDYVYALVGLGFVAAMVLIGLVVLAQHMSALCDYLVC